MSEDPHKALLEHVERLARELREVRDSTRRIEFQLDAEAVYAERRAINARRQKRYEDRQKQRQSDDQSDAEKEKETPPEVSLSRALSFPNPLEKEKEIAPPSKFVEFISLEWPDLAARAANFESRAREAFPGVDLLSEARKARGWEDANPTHKKHKHGRFFWNWLAKAQDAASQVSRVVRTVDFEAAAKVKADAAAWKQVNATQALLKKQAEERPDRTPPEEAKKRIGMLVKTALTGMEKEHEAAQAEGQSKRVLPRANGGGDSG